MLSEDRIKVLNRIKEYEKEGLWANDVEDDPEGKPVDFKVDYLGKKFSSKIKSFIANFIAERGYEKQIKNGDFIIEKVNGIENYDEVKSGGIITCNHFSVNDNYVVYRAIKARLKGKKLYKVIREGNYTSFKGLYGFFFRNCNTLPLSGNTENMKDFILAVSKLLKNNQKILIYPEQGMWWNYAKPRPLKDGAFHLAVKNDVPIIPVFITMRDLEKTLSDGSKAQGYTVWISKPIYKNPTLSDKGNIVNMKGKNYRVWQDIYECVYKKPLRY